MGYPETDFEAAGDHPQTRDQRGATRYTSLIRSAKLKPPRTRTRAGAWIELGDVDVATQKLVLAHLAAVNLEDLVPPRFIGEADLDVHLQSPRA